MGVIAVIDYGMGNLRSVQKALEVTGAKALVTSKPADLEKCGKLVFPGVGAFGDAMRGLKRFKLVEPIKDAIADGRPFLGLCLGLQLLFEKSEEAPGVKGLGLLKGGVKRFRFKDKRLKVPHMGWNCIEGAGGKSPGAGILKGVPKNSYMYFVHSYYVLPKDKSVMLTTTDYGIKFVSGVCKDNIYGFQFHPEKSQSVGLKILENFVRLK
ncbi:MAG: imidazole glycerol phosphate synthase subunit HisH [Candidatus Omnitrophota bacterium]